MRRNYYSPSTERNRKIALLLTVIAFVVLGIVLINRCSRSTREEHHPLVSEETEEGTLWNEEQEIETSEGNQNNTSEVWITVENNMGGLGNSVDTKGNDYEGNHGGQYTKCGQTDNEGNRKTIEGIKIKNKPGYRAPDTEDPYNYNTESNLSGKRAGKNNRLKDPGEPSYSLDFDSTAVPRASHRGRNPININKPVWVVVVIILLIVYIFAEVMSRGGTLILFVTPLDKVLVIVSACFYFIAWLVDRGQGFTAFQTTLFSLSGLLMMVSVTLSVIYNKFDILNIALSILAKLFYFVFINLMLLLFIVVALVYILIKIARHSP